MRIWSKQRPGAKTAKVLANEILPDAANPALQWTGRTSSNKIVNFYLDGHPASNQSLVGQLIGVRIDKAFSHSLFGKAISTEPYAGGLKGVENYAA